MNFREKAHALLKANRRTIKGHTFTVPSGGTYPHQWLWDSCFHAIVLAKLEPEAAKAELRSLFARQLPDGMVPHMIFWQSVIWPPYTYGWGRMGTSSITQPPMIAYAAWEIWRHSRDRAFLDELYPKLLAYYRYMVNDRDPVYHHLAGIINPDESGEDNSPRFDKPMHVKPDINMYMHIWKRQALVRQNRVCNFEAEICMSQTFWVKDVPFNTILIKNLERLGRIAKLLGHEDGERFTREHIDLIRGAMRERLFEDGVYWAAMGHEYEKLKVATWAHFAPLFAGLYTREEAEELVARHFYNEATFNAPFGIRTTSRQEPSYRPYRFWRGPIWMAPHWFIYKGLTAYGFHKEAAWIRERSQTLIEYNGFREYFNPETGKGYGAKHFTWGTLVLDMEGDDE
jgi:glycogen debranching enzyme